jgi:DNA modification methylase
VLDPFMGGGSTVAAALALGYDSIGIESDPVFYRMAEQSIPKLAELGVEAKPSTGLTLARSACEEHVLSLAF